MGRKTFTITAEAGELVATINQVNKTLDGMAKNSTKQAAVTQKALQGIGDAAKFATAGVKTLAAGLVVTATGGGLQSILRTADSFKQLTARVSVASEGLGDAAANYAQLSKQAQTAGTYLETTVSVFQRMAMVAPSLQATNAEILRVTDTVQKLSVITGAGSEQMKYGLTQLGQAFGQTYIMAEEFNSLNENIPGVLKAVADQMGVTTDELRNMQREGKLASKDFFEALLAASAKADEAFTKMPVTIERATNSIRISFTNMIGKFDEATGASGTLAEALLFLSRGFERLTKFIDENKEAFFRVQQVILGTAKVIASAGALIVADAAGIVRNVTRMVQASVSAAIRGVEFLLNAALGKLKLFVKAASGIALPFEKLNIPTFGLGNVAGSIRKMADEINKGMTGASSTLLKGGITHFSQAFDKYTPPKVTPFVFRDPIAGGSGAGGARGARGAGSGGSGRNSAGRSSSVGAGRGGTKATPEREFVAERIDPLSDYMKGLFSRSADIINSLKTPLDTFNEQVAELDLLAKHNLISFDNFNQKLAEYRQELDSTIPATETLTGSWEDYSKAASTASTAMNDLQQVTVNVGTEFANMVASGKVSFADLASSLLRDIARVAIQLKIVTPLMNSLFGAKGLGGGLLSQIGGAIKNKAFGFSMPSLRGIESVVGSAPVPGFANGGMPPVGRPVLVGERGAELVTFGQQARVHSNTATKAMLGGGSNVVVNIHNAPEGTKTQRRSNGGLDIVDIIIGTVNNNISSGGSIAQAIGSRMGVNPAHGLAR